MSGTPHPCDLIDRVVTEDMLEVHFRDLTPLDRESRNNGATREFHGADGFVNVTVSRYSSSNASAIVGRDFFLDIQKESAKALELWKEGHIGGAWVTQSALGTLEFRAAIFTGRWSVSIILSTSGRYSWHFERGAGKTKVREIVSQMRANLVALGYGNEPLVVSDPADSGEELTLNVALYRYVPDLDFVQAVITEAWTADPTAPALNFVNWDCYQNDRERAEGIMRRILANPEQWPAEIAFIESLNSGNEYGDLLLGGQGIWIEALGHFAFSSGHHEERNDLLTLENHHRV